MDTQDIHLKTLEDPEFQYFMDRFLPNWRELSISVQRLYAKRWNFTKLYGVGSSDFIRSLKDG